MPRTKGSKNRPKTTNDYTTQIAEKQEQITTFTTEIASIQKVIEEQKNTLKEKKVPLKKRRKRKPRVWSRSYCHRHRQCDCLLRCGIERVPKKKLLHTYSYFNF